MEFSRRKVLSLLSLVSAGGLATARPAAAAQAVSVQGLGVNLIRVLTQAQYDALTVKPSTTLFVIRG